MSACYTTQIDWANKIKESDRSSTVSGMLSELDDFEAQYKLMMDVMSPKKTKDSDDEELLKISQVDRLLALDRRPTVETYDLAASAEAFMFLEEAREKLTQEKSDYLDKKGELVAKNKAQGIDKKVDFPEPASLVSARKNVRDVYASQAPALSKFVKDKLNHNRVHFAQLIIGVFNKSFDDKAPCRQEELVDALRVIGNALHTENSKQFMQGELYTEITKVFARAIQQDISQPPATAIIVVNTLNNWKAIDQLDHYLTIFNQERVDFELKDALVKMIKDFALTDEGSKYKAKIAPALKKVLMTESTEQPVYYIGNAALALAHLGVDDADVIERLVECLWLDDAFGRNANARCRLALNTLDPKKVSPVIQKTFKRQNKKVEDRAYRLNYAHTGLIEAKSAEIISDIRDKGSIDQMIMALERNDKNPEAFSKEPARTAFIKGQVQKMISISRSLAVFGDSRAVSPLMNFINSKGDESPVEYKLAASQQLAYLGSTKALKPLLKIYNKKMTQEDTDLRRMQVQYGKTIAFLIRKGRELKGFDKSAKKDLNLVTEWHKKAEEQKKTLEDNKKKAEEEKTKLEGEVKKLKEEKKVSLPEKPKRKKIDKSVAEKEGEKAFKKAQEEANKAFGEEVKKYLDALSEDQKTLLKTEEGVIGQKRLIRKLKNDVLNTELYINLYGVWKIDYQTIIDQIAVINLVSSDNQWAEKMKDKSSDIRALATYTLARVGSNSRVANKAFIDRLTLEEDFVVRDLILFGLTRHAKKDQVSELRAARKNLDAKNKIKPSANLKGALYTLDLLIEHLDQ
jgi:hypothetical protein